MSSSLHLLGNNLKGELVLQKGRDSMFDGMSAAIMAGLSRSLTELESGSGTGYFHYPSILRARKLNQRAKAQRRGCPTAGRTDGRWRYFYTGRGPYINPERQEKKRQKRALNCSGKRLRRIKNAERRAS